MSFYGELNKDGDNYTGFIADLMFDAEIVLTPYVKPANAKKDTAYPNWNVSVKSPAGRLVPNGAGWNEVSEKENDYISLSLSIGGQSIRANAVQMPNNDAELVIMPLSKRKAKAKKK